ncbi:MAG: ATPase, T2SS/T4P/T4SS family, partial [Bdellovibrionales bacterium]|nr:ATPase, T2SS/T4P/T4SS family [Bdellovibrionales bacterium]
MAVNPNSFIIGVTGGKGGMGKSVFSANLALAFALEMKQPTLLIDFDSQSCGDQNFLLGMREVKTVAELANFTGSITPQTVPSVATMVPGTSMGYIAAVRGRDENLGGGVEQVIKQIENLSNVFRYIILDLGNQLGPMQMAAIEKTTALLLVTAPEVLAVNQTMRMMTELLAANLPTEVLQIIVNKASPAGLAPASIGQSLRKNILGIIPQDDATVMGSVARSAPFVISAPKSAVATSHFDVVRRLTGGLLQQLKAATKPQKLQIKESAKPADAPANAARAKGIKNLDPRTALKLTIHNELIKAMDLKKGVTDTQGDPDKEAELRKKTNAVIATILDKESPGLGRDDRARIITEVLDEALGLGALEDLLADSAVTEIMVCGHEKIYIEKNGLVQLSPTKFTSNFHLRKVIERIVAPLGRQINESVPYVDARLQDGSRVNAVIEPLAIDGPAVTIRKFRKGSINPDTYHKEWNACTANMMEFLRICVANKMNVIISGGTGSGKTTLLNTLSSFIPSNERVVTIEDAAELQLKQEHVVRLETRPANMEGTGAVTIRDLVKNSLRMRPDRIVVGECRDGAALDMLGAMSTGHDGSMTTIHANNPKEAIGRIENLCMMAGMGLPANAIREQIANAVNLIVQIQRLSDGSRKLISISEVQGMQGEVVTQQEVFRFVEKGFDRNRKIVGEFQATGLIPKCIEKFEKRG